MSPGDPPFRLGAWRIDPAAFEATRDATTVRLEPKAVAVLTHLAAHAGEVVSRAALLAAVWPDVVVTDASLTRCVSQLRQALGDDPQAPRLIETIPKAGYRLLVAPTPVAEAAPPPRRLPTRWIALAAVVAALLAWMLVAALRPEPGLEVTARVDLDGAVDSVAVTVTGPEGAPVTVRPDAFPFETTVAGAPGATVRLRVRGRSAGADLRLSLVARRGAEVVVQHETTHAVGPGPAQAFSVSAQLTLDE